MKDLSLHILDIAQNSIRARASEIVLEVTEDIDSNMLLFSCFDNGKGMSAEMLENVSDPFCTSRTTRNVGLGLPLLRQNAELANGEFKINSKPGEGTQVVAQFEHNHIDRIPVGDIAGTVSMLIGSYTDINIIFRYNYNNHSYEISSKELTEQLDGISLNEPKVIIFLTKHIAEKLDETKTEKKNK